MLLSPLRTKIGLGPSMEVFSRERIPSRLQLRISTGRWQWHRQWNLASKIGRLASESWDHRWCSGLLNYLIDGSLKRQEDHTFKDSELAKILQDSCVFFVAR